MYVRRFGITDFRGITKLEWRLEPKQSAPGWHVFIGDNGSGKSSVLRALALAFVGPAEAPRLQQNWNDWIRFGRGSSRISVQLERTAPFDAGGTRTLSLDVSVHRHPAPHVRARRAGAQPWTATSGWFAASYGPFRRFSGGDRAWENVLQSLPRPGRHLSMFSESVALMSGLERLCKLRVAKLAGNTRAGPALDEVVRFVNQPGFLPHGMTLDDVTEEEVIFRDAARSRVRAENLSDGFRSVLSLTFELLRQLFHAFPSHRSRLFDSARRTVQVPGVVLVDEVDAHLHPTWQRSIGPWFCRHFPRVQFMVTTHSPLVCQASENGTVFRLPVQGSGERAQFVGGIDRLRLVSGDVSEAYGTGMFGLKQTRSDSAQAKVKKLAELNTRALTTGLNAKQRAEREELRAALPIAAAEVA